MNDVGKIDFGDMVGDRNLDEIAVRTGRRILSSLIH
jgi:hypothetical protein